MAKTLAMQEARGIYSDKFLIFENIAQDTVKS